MSEKGSGQDGGAGSRTRRVLLPAVVTGGILWFAFAGAANAGAPAKKPKPASVAQILRGLLDRISPPPKPPVITPSVVAPPPPPAPVPVVPTVAGLTPGTPCTVLARACFSVSQNRAWLIHNGTVVLAVPALGARRGYAVPQGTFAVTMKDKHHYSTLYDAPMPYSVFFHGGAAFHEGSLSTSSHGCIHLSRDAAVAFYNDLQVGDRVEVVA